MGGNFFFWILGIRTATLTHCIIAGEARIFVNDQLVSTNISEMNSRAGEHKSVPVELRLNLGDENTITFGVAGDKGTLVPLSIILKLPFERRDKPYMLTVTFRLRGPLGWY